MKNLTIKLKLIILAVFIAAVLLIIETLVFISVRKINRLHDLVKSADEVAIYSFKMRRTEKDFLAREVKNEKFFKTNVSEYYDLLKELTGKSQGILKTLEEDKLISEFGLTDQMASCSKDIQLYFATFSNIAEAINEKGYKEYGLAGGMEKNISQLEYNVDLPDIENRITSIRYIEKEYFLYQDIKYAEELNKLGAGFISYLTNKNINESAKRHIVEGFGKYMEDFNKIVELDKKIGYNEKEGLMFEMRNAVHQIEPAVENIQIKIKANVDNYTSSTLINLLIVIFVILIIVSGSIRYIIKYINSKLILAQESVKAVAEGDFTRDLTIENHDEIGNLLTDVQNMTLKLRRSVSIAHKVSKGDLTIFSDGSNTSLKGELDFALKDMVDNLTIISEEILNGANTIASASEQISSTAQQMSQGASEQASSSEEISSSMEEIVSSIEQTTENSQNTEKISLKAADEILETNLAVTQTLDAMKLIAAKISIINEIANKTDLLAVNAGIEAARAGEQGKGFAIVAVEVRKLAENSRKSSHEIIDLVNNCLQKAERSNILLTGIVPEIEKTARLIQEISASSQEQNSGVVQINTAITQLNQVTQLNAASSEELATSAEELTSQAEQFLQSISFFKVEMPNKPVQNQLRRDSVSHFNAVKLKKPALKEKGVNIELTDNDKKDSDFKSY